MTETARERESRLEATPWEVFDKKGPRSERGSGGAFRQVLARRQLLGQLVRRELKVRYKDSVLGFLWTLIRPLTMLVIYYVAIGKFLGGERSVPSFAIFVFTGLTLWGFYSEIISSSTTSILTNAGLIKKVYLPRELFPLASVGSALVNFGTQLAILIAATLVLLQPPTLAILWSAPLSFLIVLVWGLAFGLVFAALNVYLRDVQYLVEVALLVLFWASPITYSWALVKNALGGSLAWLQEVYLANPTSIAVIGFQQGFWRAGADQPVPPGLPLRMLGCLIAGAIALAIAQRVFTRLQGNFAQEI